MRRADSEGKLMRIFGFVTCLATLLVGGVANASVIFDNITGITPLGSFGTVVSNRSPFGDSFAVADPSIITSVTLSLDAFNNTDGGELLIFLVPNAPGNIPSSTGRVLTNKTLVGTVLDSALTLAESEQTLNTNLTVGPGTYWIELVNSGDTANGGDGIVSNTGWFGNNNGRGVGITGEFESLVGDSSNFVSVPDSLEAFRMIVETTSVPEPSSIALLGAGLIGLGLARWGRKPRKLAVAS